MGSLRPGFQTYSVLYDFEGGRICPKIIYGASKSSLWYLMDGLWFMDQKIVLKRQRMLEADDTANTINR